MRRKNTINAQAEESKSPAVTKKPETTDNSNEIKLSENSEESFKSDDKDKPEDDPVEEAKNNSGSSI